MQMSILRTALRDWLGVGTCLQSCRCVAWFCKNNGSLCLLLVHLRVDVFGVRDVVESGTKVRKRRSREQIVGLRDADRPMMVERSMLTSH